jgi:hypothetical protein
LSQGSKAPSVAETGLNCVAVCRTLPRGADNRKNLSDNVSSTDNLLDFFRISVRVELHELMDMTGSAQLLFRLVLREAFAAGQVHLAFFVAGDEHGLDVRELLDQGQTVLIELFSDLFGRVFSL